MLTNNMPKKHLRKVREFLRRVTPFLNKDPIPPNIKSTIVQFLKITPARGYLLYLFDSIMEEGIVTLDPSYVDETIKFKKDFFYKINIGAYRPPRPLTPVLSGPDSCAYGEIKELGLKCLFFGECHSVTFTDQLFMQGTPVWQWITAKAKQIPIDLYSETSYISEHNYPNMEGASSSTNDDSASALMYIANIPGTEHYLRHHRCDLRDGIRRNNIPTGEFTLGSVIYYHFDIPQKYNPPERDKKRQDILNEIQDSGKNMDILKYLCGFSNNSSIYDKLVFDLFKLYPEAKNGGLGPLRTDSTVREKIQKQLDNLRIDRELFVNAFFESFSDVKDGLKGIFGAPMDCYLFARMLRNYSNSDKISPINYEKDYAVNAIVYTGSAHTEIYVKMMEKLGFTSIFSKFTNFTGVVLNNDLGLTPFE